MASLIPIGTCLPGANAEGALRAAMDYGFETGSVNFHMKTMDKAGLAALAERLNRIRDGRDFQITTLGFYLNPIENAEHFACLKTVIDCAHLFGATHVSTFAGALSGRPVEESIPKFGEVFRELAARAEDAGIKLGIECCPMGGGWHSATCNIGFTPRAWELMFDEVRSENFGLEWEPTHVMVQLIDPIANLKDWIHKVVHVHGKDANIDWEGIRNTACSGVPVPMRATGFPAWEIRIGEKSLRFCATGDIRVTSALKDIMIGSLAVSLK